MPCKDTYADVIRMLQTLAALLWAAIASSLLVDVGIAESVDASMRRHAGLMSLSIHELRVMAAHCCPYLTLNRIRPAVTCLSVEVRLLYLALFDCNRRAMHVYAETSRGLIRDRLLARQHASIFYSIRKFYLSLRRHAATNYCCCLRGAVYLPILLIS